MNLADWHELFLAAAGAAAGLAGLIMVALSVNIEMIVKYPSMASRAGASIAGLMLVVIVTIAGLVPDLTDAWLGAITIGFTLVALGFAIDSVVRIAREPGGKASQTVAKTALTLAPLLSFLVGGVVLLTGVDGGLNFVAAGILLVFVGSVTNAWVLLVEIRR